ncbi:hypothetical protein EVAR_83505_1 [Eumeta japonica]|uniref:Uncharacterized protein n=1 Tax=Eumeta variegata TaxID=151549 RepID=A0A4C1Y1U9_EUMVA|nr:hypothetical protein EVAR_83505_1 [Eumeta japonica]
MTIDSARAQNLMGPQATRFVTQLTIARPLLSERLSPSSTRRCMSLIETIPMRDKEKKTLRVKRYSVGVRWYIRSHNCAAGVGASSKRRNM